MLLQDLYSVVTCSDYFNQYPSILADSSSCFGVAEEAFLALRDGHPTEEGATSLTLGLSDSSTCERKKASPIEVAVFIIYSWKATPHFVAGEQLRDYSRNCSPLLATS